MAYKFEDFPTTRASRRIMATYDQSVAFDRHFKGKVFLDFEFLASKFYGRASLVPNFKTKNKKAPTGWPAKHKVRSILYSIKGLFPIGA